MNNFEFFSPTKVYFGKKEEYKIGEIVKHYNFKKVLYYSFSCRQVFLDMLYYFR